MKFSVITLIDRRGQNIDDAVRGVLCQSCQDYEHILAFNDDCVETDVMFDRFPHLSHCLVTGQDISGYREACQYANGKYIVFVGPRDRLSPFALERASEYFQKGFRCVAGNVDVFDINENYLFSHKPSMDAVEMIFFWQINAFPIAPCGVFLEKDLINGVSLKEGLDYRCQWYEFMLRISSSCSTKKLDEVIARFCLPSGLSWTGMNYNLEDCSEEKYSFVFDRISQDGIKLPEGLNSYKSRMCQQLARFRKEVVKHRGNTLINTAIEEDRVLLAPSITERPVSNVVVNNVFAYKKETIVLISAVRGCITRKFVQGLHDRSYLPLLLLDGLDDPDALIQQRASRRFVERNKDNFKWKILVITAGDKSEEDEGDELRLCTRRNILGLLDLEEGETALEEEHGFTRLTGGACEILFCSDPLNDRHAYGELCRFLGV